jgi:D-glycero-D-manno-heptose 1,7-bisphosphate phosphatase
MANKAVFLDRDDTLIHDPGYINDPDQVELIEGVPQALIELRRLGYKLIIVSNQSGVARGIVTEKKLAEIHERLEQLLAEQGAKLDKIYYCPYHPEGAVAKYRKHSDCRKPKPGMILTAAEEMDIDPAESWLVGDSSHDIEAGKSAGCTTILIQNATHNRTLEPGQTEPDYMAVNMKEVVNIIKKHIRNRQDMEIEKTEKKQTDNKVEPLMPYASKPEPIKETEETEQPTSQPAKQQQLLAEILDQLRRNQRSEMFGEFSVTRFMAMTVQVIVLACLLISVWLLMSPTRQADTVLISLVFALVFQMMALTFFVMQRQK